MTQTPPRRLVVETDGGSRGNPGVAGYGALVRDADTGRALVELAEPLGVASNNVAEYSGLIAGLRAAAEIDPGAAVLVRMDSRLVVEQMSGRWKIKHESMRRLALEARDLCARIGASGGSVAFEWVPRERNQEADALSNAAMDGQSVHRIHADEQEAGAESTGPGAVAGSHATGPAGESVDAVAGSGPPETLRLLLVQVPEGDEPAEAITSGVLRLVGPGARVVSSPDPLAAGLASAIAARLGADPVRDDGWAGPSGGAGADARVRAAYQALWQTGGMVVAVTTRRGVLTVLADVLRLPEDRFWTVAGAPGSLTAIEVWPDGTASVAFTNRTAHLR